MEKGLDKCWNISKLYKLDTGYYRNVSECILYLVVFGPLHLTPQMIITKKLGQVLEVIFC